MRPDAQRFLSKLINVKSLTSFGSKKVQRRFAKRHSLDARTLAHVARLRAFGISPGALSVNMHAQA